MNNINVTFELCAEDRARLDNLAKAIEALTAKPLPDLALAPVKKEEPKKEEAAPAPEPKQESPSPVEPAPEPEKPATAPAPEVTTAELQSKVVKLVSAGKKDEARGIVMEYADSVSGIPAEKRAEVLERLNALEV